jgi:hypothetical protein
MGGISSGAGVNMVSHFYMEAFLENQLGSFK